MLQNYFSLRHFWRTKWSFLVHSTMHNASYIHTSHDWILELWRTFPNVYIRGLIQRNLAKLAKVVPVVLTGELTLNKH